KGLFPACMRGPGIGCSRNSASCQPARIGFLQHHTAAYPMQKETDAAGTAQVVCLQESDSFCLIPLHIRCKNGFTDCAERCSASRHFLFVPPSPPSGIVAATLGGCFTGKAACPRL